MIMASARSADLHKHTRTLSLSVRTDAENVADESGIADTLGQATDSVPGDPHEHVVVVHRCPISEAMR